MRHPGSLLSFGPLQRRGNYACAVACVLRDHVGGSLLIAWLLECSLCKVDKHTYSDPSNTAEQTVHSRQSLFSRMCSGICSYAGHCSHCEHDAARLSNALQTIYGMLKSEICPRQCLTFAEGFALLQVSDTDSSLLWINPSSCICWSRGCGESSNNIKLCAARTHHSANTAHTYKAMLIAESH